MWQVDCRSALGSASMQCRDEEDVVVFLQDIVGFAFKFPVGVVDEDEDSRATRIKLTRIRVIGARQQTWHHPRRRSLLSGLS